MEGKQKNIPLWRRYVDGLYTKDDVQLLKDELNSDSSDYRLLDSLSAEVWEESAVQQPYTDLEREKYKKEARMLLKCLEHKKPAWRRRILYATAGIAALLCLVLGSVGYLRYLERQQLTYLEASTSFGEHKDVRLPDGSMLTLNACSRVRYPDRFAGKERRIELEGEGFFRVQRNEAQPFIVRTRFFDVRVLGTSFNIKSYATDELVSVDVESGKVQVDLPEAMMRLAANEHVQINTQSGEYSKQREAHAVAVWRERSLRFDATPIHDVAKELERMYNCRISFAADTEFDNLISGEHDNKSLEAVLQSIEYTSGIHYRLSGNEVLLYKD